MSFHLQISPMEFITIFRNDFSEWAGWALAMDFGGIWIWEFNFIALLGNPVFSHEELG